jgi:hypothetical protein
MLNYESLYRSKYKARLFLTAGSKAKLVDSIELLLKIGLVETEATGTTARLAAFKSWLEENAGWLLLVDNVGVEEQQMVLDLLPETSNGYTILTSQRRGVMERITGHSKLSYEIREPNWQDAVDMFIKSCGIERNAESERLSIEIVKDLGYLPHAVRQSSSYIRENGISLDEFIVQFSKAPKQVKSPH